RGHALIEKFSFHWIARQRARRAEVLARCRVPPAAHLELAERRRVKWISSKALAVLYRADRLEPALRSIALGDGDGTIERNHRRRTHRDQHIVERNDPSPVGILGARGACVNRGDRRFEVILGKLRATG